MPTVTTTTESNGFSFPPMSLLERSPTTGELWLVFRSATTVISVYKSSDNGVSWASQGSFTRSGLYDIAAARLDQAGDHLHLIYLVSESSIDKVFYKRVDIRSGTPSFGSGEMQVTATANGGVARSVWYSAAVYPYKNPDDSYSLLVIGAYHQTSDSGILIFGISIKNDGAFTTYLNNNIIHPGRNYKLNGNDSSVTVSVDVEHNGDGYTTSTPNLWLSFMLFGNCYAIKLTWQGYKSGWASPGQAAVVVLNRINTRDQPGRWDGKRFVTITPSVSDVTRIDVYERDAGNTTNAATRTTPSLPTNTVTAFMLSYNHITQDLRVYAVGTATAVLYFVDYIRATATWGAWAIANATAPVAGEWSVRRGTYGANQYDVYMETGAGTPWNIVTFVQAVNFAPTAPTWVTGTAGTPITNGAAFDVTASLTLDWNHNDPNPTDAQTQYALSRQIGAGTIQWWRTSDSTWQTTETFNTSATTAVTLTTGQWVGGGGAADAAHVYKVRTIDTGGLSSAYSAGLSVVPSTRVDPTLTAPTAAQILNSGVVTATWTITEQSAFRVTVTNTATGAVTHDSGWQADPGATPSILSYTVPTVLPDGYAGSLTLQSRNAEGLASVVRTVAFTVDFVEPVAPLITGLVADPNAGGMDVTVTQPAATGTQPATSYLDMWRRKVVSVTPVNANPYFETNANDWSNAGYTSAVRSTTFAHTGVASLFLTPSGAAATPYVQTTAIYPTAAGTRWEARGWFRSTTANKTVRIKLQWYDVANALISESVRDMTPVAGVWIWVWFTAAAPANATGVRWAIGQLATPAAGDTMYIDEAVLITANDDPGIPLASGILSGQTVLDWRAVTGIDYEYRAYAQGANATSVYGPWQA